MDTYKLHALGDYVTAIRRFGTTDNYSTQVVSHFFYSSSLSIVGEQGELEHRRVKRFYPRTNKSASFTQQISKHQRREQILRKIRDRVLAHERDDKDMATSASKSQRSAKRLEDIVVPFAASEPLPPASPEKHHQISTSRRYPINFMQWTDEHWDDPAIRV
jgi:hypothetical protein